jgi:hypothetical protein
MILLNIIYSQMTPFCEQLFLLDLKPLSFLTMPHSVIMIMAMLTYQSAYELPLALDAYSDTHDLWTNLSEHFPTIPNHFQPLLTLCKLLRSFVNLGPLS